MLLTGSRRAVLLLSVLAALVSVAVPAETSAAAPSAAPTQVSAAAAGVPLSVIPIMSGLSGPWDVAFLPDASMLVTQRDGTILRRTPIGQVNTVTADMSDLWVSGETALMAIEVDPFFSTNRRFYTCQGTTDSNFTVQVVAWTLNAAGTVATRANDPLVGGIDGRSGRHGGCQLRIDGPGWLHVGTGDAAWGTNPQDRRSLAGKTLRVDRFSGGAATENLFNGVNGDARIFTYGHRNVQGLALQPGTGEVWSVEHGSDRDDEVNRLFNGADYGWNPVPTPYTEAGTPMTAPGATPAVWSSGFPTIAPSGATFLRGSQWGTWEGDLAVSTLRGSSLRIMNVSGTGITSVDVPPELNGTYGRLRAAEMGLDGRLYLTTSNGPGQDHVLAVGATGPFGPTVTSSVPGSIDLIRPTATTSLAHRFCTDGVCGQTTDLLGFATSDADVASWGPGRRDVFVRGTDDGVWHRPGEGGAWGAWRTIGGTARSGPSVASFVSGHLEVFVRGANNELWANQFYVDHWTGWYSLGGGIISDPDVVAVAPGRLLVMARGTDGGLWYRQSNGGAWGPWTWLNSYPTSGPGAATAGGGVAEIFVRGADGALWTNRLTASGWTGWSSLGGHITSDPDAASPSAGRMEVFVRGGDGGTWRRARNGTVWGPWTYAA